MTIKNIISTFTCFCLFCIGGVIHVHCSLTTESLSQPSIKRQDASNLSLLLPPTNDYIFTKLFGSDNDKNKHILKCLLNAILNGEPYVQEVTLGPTEYRKTAQDGKSARLDIKATINDGTIVDVEMQCINTGDIYHRSIYYQSLILRDYTIKQGQSYKAIPDVIIIWIMNQNITNRKGCMHEIVPMYKANGIDPIEIASNKTRQFIIELTKLENDSTSRHNKKFIAWMTFIKDPGSISREFLEIDGVQDAMNELEYMSTDQETRTEYNDRCVALLDFNSAVEYSREEGKAEGRTEIIKNMISENLSIDTIVRLSGLSREDIEKIKNN